MKRNKVEIAVPKSPEGIQQAVETTIETLEQFGVGKKARLLFSMRLEELLLYLSSGEWKTEDTLKVQIRKLLDEVSIRILLRGQKIELPQQEEASQYESDLLLSREDADVASQLNEILISSALSSISFRYHEHTNDLILYVQRSRYEQLRSMLIAMVLGLLSGFLLKAFVPESAVSYISENILSTGTTMFMNAIKMLVGPTVFCSIVACISQHSNFAMLQNIAKRTLLHYFLDAIFAMLLATGICFVFEPGLSAVGFVLKEEASADLVQTAGQTQVNLWKTIQDIIPANMVNSFLSTSILQIMFIAVLFGIALGQVGAAGDTVRSFLSGLNKIFTRMMSYIMTFLPVMVFCSMSQITINFGSGALANVLLWLVLIFASFLLMIVLYSLLVWLRTGTRPKDFFSKISSCLMVAFSMGSSNAAMPTTLETCEKKLGIDKKICSFTVPFGVSIHTASSCIFYIISTVFLCNLFYGENILPSLGVVFYVSVLLLALGAPGVSGSGPVCVAMLLSSLGAPMSLISMILAWDPLVSTIKTCCSCMEDLSVSYMVSGELSAATEK